MITVRDYSFLAQWENGLAPETCAAFSQMLPLENQLIQARWSGEAAWIPMGDFDLGVGSENATAYPSAGNILFYPAGISETEILFVYGYAAFASKAGVLAGNHFLTIIEGNARLEELGRTVLWEGAQPIRFALSR